MGNLNIEELKEKVVKNVYHMSKRQGQLHAHKNHDEVFYCISGSGYGVLESEKVELTVGKTFTVPAGINHTIGSDGDLYVCAFLVPVVE